MKLARYHQFDSKCYQSNKIEDWAYLGNGLQAAVWLKLVDTMALGLAVCAALWHWAFAATTTHANAVDDEALL